MPTCTCKACNNEQAQEGSEFILCRGICKQFYHVSCADTSEDLSHEAKQKWKCKDCQDAEKENSNELVDTSLNNSESLQSVDYISTNSGSSGRSECQAAKNGDSDEPVDSTSLNNSESLQSADYISPNGKSNGSDECQAAKNGDSNEPVDTTSLNNSESLQSVDYVLANGEYSRSNEVLQSTERELNANGQELKKIRKDLEYLRTQFNELCYKLAEIECYIRNHKRQLSEYSNEVNEAKKNIYVLGQSFRINRIEIHGLILTSDILTCDIKKKLVELSKCFKINGFSEEDIDVVYVRKTKYHIPPPIVVQFKSRDIRNKWIAKRKNIVNNSKLPGGISNARIYINENLSTYYRSLWYEARVLAKEKGCKFVWVKDGKLFIRQTGTSPIKRITSRKDLDEFSSAI